LRDVELFQVQLQSSSIVGVEVDDQPIELQVKFCQKFHKTDEFDQSYKRILMFDQDQFHQSHGNVIVWLEILLLQFTVEIFVRVDQFLRYCI